ncbi:MAG: ABC transporter permease subunit [Clostridia bacterium]|nr:ABC transporter permease subunit [Clostridia bacterium]
MEKPQKENPIVRGCKRIASWFRRAFTGNKWQDAEGEIESPSKLLRQSFFRKKGAVVALVLLVGLFLFVFIAPLFAPMDVNYTDPLQQNVAPVYSLRKVPRKLKGAVQTIDGFSGFTVGLSSEGEAFVWGSSTDKLQKTDLKELPDSVKEEGAAHIAAGKDHILAVTKSGKLVGWGDRSCGQYGFDQILNALTTPDELAQGIAPERVKRLVCGYQTSALVTTEGKALVWGNLNAVRNLASMQGLEGVADIAFTNSAAVALLFDGSVTTGSERVFTSLVSSRGATGATLSEYLADKKAVAIATTNKCLAVLIEDGELVVSGVFENGEELLPVLQEGEYFTSLDGGTRHFVGVTNLGNAYAWGHNAYGQCELEQNGSAARAFAGSLQTYVVDGEGRLVQSVGLKGYPLGTDGRGRDVFTRIIHGGKMTMTIGAVAVLVSSTIAVIVGCVSGYFGGVVDTLLMRITEIFSSIPFLPFAMLLSQIIKNYNIPETTRIFIIMLILGALSWTGLARMIRGQVLVEREKEFVVAARAIGVKERRIAFRHVLPNVVSVILVSMTLDFAGCLLTESSLSYLGFGVQQPQPTWGNMLTGCNNSVVIQNYWWQWLFPALFLSLATICINVVGDALRDALDPKSHLEK